MSNTNEASTRAKTARTPRRRPVALKKADAPASPGREAGQPPTKSRRRPAVIAAGVALAIVGGLGSWFYASTVGDTVTVLTTSADIARGATITSENLTTLQIAGGQDTTAVAAEQAASVIGETATVDLPTGTMITSDNVGAGIAVETGQSIVGVALSVAQLPSYPLAAGDQVRLVDTPVSQGDPPASSPESFEATVFTTRFDEGSSTWIVDLVVPQSQAADIAARGATGRVALILDSVAAE
ncbi:hypothetical protein D6T64_21630 [Cryobacterium melibiosiphilum]|uniref:SAF domain-containing protein n=1 Tax=Cryobacterium melibiosiphilum TaxID=995039 RepID=A0A3A5M7Q8_9MICO|nr:SAF domain-containing protein [Cryobacterium melibiosiphilum]RJT84748.1 hypothetical protein D6T64_21630 [Cryobacterium melibiosiphilum]